MKEPRQILWWGLSIIALLLGIGMAGFIMLGGQAPRGAELLLCGLYWALTGGASLLARIQMARADLASAGKHRRRADLSLLLAGAPLLAVGLWASQAELRTHMHAPTMVAGQIERLQSYGGRRSTKGVRIWLAGRETALEWDCGWFLCSRRDKVMAVPQGASVEVAVVGDKAVGLRTADGWLMDPKVEQRKLLVWDGVILGVVILLTGAAVFYAWRWTFGWRARDRKAEQLALSAFRGRDWPGLDERKP